MQSMGDHQQHMQNERSWAPKATYLWVHLYDLEKNKGKRMKQIAGCQGLVADYERAQKEEGWRNGLHLEGGSRPRCNLTGLYANRVNFTVCKLYFGILKLHSNKLFLCVCTVFKTRSKVLRGFHIVWLLCIPGWHEIRYRSVYGLGCGLTISVEGEDWDGEESPLSGYQLLGLGQEHKTRE